MLWRSYRNRVLSKMEKYCCFCEESFIPKGNSQKFCSNSCRNRNATQKHKIYRRGWKIKKRGGEIDRKSGYEIRKCKGCGTQFINKRDRKLFCSHLCQRRFFSRKYESSDGVKEYRRTYILKNKQKISIRMKNHNDRDKIFSLTGEKCCLCNNPATQIHHRKYSGDWRDCVPVCSKCHGLFNSIQRNFIKKGGAI